MPFPAPLCLPLLVVASVCFLSASVRSGRSGLTSLNRVQRSHLFQQPEDWPEQKDVSDTASWGQESPTPTQRPLPLPPQTSRPINIAVVGLTGDGKSTFCNWFLGGTAKFKASASTKSETQKVAIARGRIFGDATYPEVIIADTPGLADTDGQDATIWHGIVEDLRENFDGELDVVLWVVNGAVPRWSDDRQAMIEAQRFTFGYKYWKHMAVLFTHYPSKATVDDPSGHSSSEKAAKANEWRTKLKASDNGYFATGITDDIIDSMEFYFTDTPQDLSERFFVNYDHQWAHAKDAVAWSRDSDGMTTYTKTGMVDLNKFALDISRKLNAPDYTALDLKELSPRMGPGEIIGDQAFICEWPGKVHCSLDIEGHYMSDKDEIRLVAEGTQCGKSAKLMAAEYGMQFTQQRARTDGGGLMRTFELGSLQNENSVGTFEVCYCEAGRCEDDRRFGQHAGRLFVKWSECALPVFSNAQMRAYPAVDPLSAAMGSLKPLGSTEIPEKVPRLGAATFTCDEGYTATGLKDAQSAFNVECSPQLDVDAGDWVTCLHPPCECNIVHCAVALRENSEPIAKKDAVIDFGSEATFKCKNGFTTSRDGEYLESPRYTAVCEADGKMSDEQCVRVSCGTLSTPSNARSSVQSDDLIRFGDKVQYDCEPGYSLDGRPPAELNVQFEMFCTAAGKLSGTGLCIPVSCGAVGDLRELPGAVAERPDAETIYPHSAAYNCKKGYVAQADGKTSFTRQCLAHGKFEYREGCRPVTCDVSEDPVGAHLVNPVGAQVVDFGKTVRYTCNPGFSLNGFDFGSYTNFEYERTCEISGTKGVLSTGSKCSSTTDKVMPPDALGYVIACDKQAQQILGVNTEKANCRNPRIVCAPGYFGHARVNANVSGPHYELSGCDPCPKGTASKTAAVSTCPKCPANQYQDSVGSQSCKRCHMERVTDPHEMATSAASCIDVSHHKCCCGSSGESCFLVHRNVQKGPNGLYPKFMAQKFGGLCPMIEEERRCATWQGQSAAFTAITTETKASMCRPGTTPIVNCKCHGTKSDACKDN